MSLKMDLTENILEKTLSKKRQILEAENQKPWLVFNLIGAFLLSYYL